MQQKATETPPVEAVIDKGAHTGPVQNNGASPSSQPPASEQKSEPAEPKPKRRIDWKFWQRRGEKQYTAISPEDVQKRLKAHKTWVENGCKPDEAGRADFTDCNLSGVKFVGENLQKVV